MALDPNRIHKPIRKLRKLLKKNPKQPTPGEVHDLRTNARRVEATLSALSLDSQGLEWRLLKDLGEIRKRAGKVRDMDVLVSYAAHLHANSDQDCEVQLIEHLGAKRRKGGQKLHRTIGKYGAKTRNRLKRTSRDLEQVLCENGNKKCDPAAASTQAAAQALRLEHELTDPPRLGRKNLHPYRLKVKELHNILKMAANGDDQEFTAALGAVKDAIGEWHDWEELLAIAEKTLDHGAQCKVLRELKQTCERKYEQALAEAESMRKKYLRVSRSNSKRQTAIPADAVLKATTAIAA